MYTDLHCHCLPSLDDGPVDTTESLAMCRALVADGITKVIATPHQLGRFDGLYEAGDIRSAVTDFKTQLADAGVPLEVLAGAEIRVDERIISLLEEDRILTLADGGRFLLLELMPDIMIDVSFLIDQLADRGVTTIIAHPERCEYLGRNLQVVSKWLDIGAKLQVTACSLIGQCGTFAKKFGWNLLERNWVSYIATDAHSLEIRRPAMKAAYDAISETFGRQRAEELCVINPDEVASTADSLKS